MASMYNIDAANLGNTTTVGEYSLEQLKTAVSEFKNIDRTRSVSYEAAKSMSAHVQDTVSQTISALQHSFESLHASAKHGTSTGAVSAHESFRQERTTAAQKTAYWMAGLLGTIVANGGTAALEAAGRDLLPLPPVVGGKEFVADMPSGQTTFTTRVALEGFDPAKNPNLVEFSQAFNMNALSSSGQDFLGNWFPPVVMAPDQLGFRQSIDLVQVQENVRRNIDGSVVDFERKSLVRALINHKLLDNHLTRLVPIKRGANSDWFSTAIGEFDLEVDRQTIKTGAVLFGKEYDMIGACTPDSMVGTPSGNTDTIDPAIKLDKVFMVIADQKFKFDISNLPFAAFTKSVQQNAFRMNVDFTTTSLLLRKGSKDMVGGALVGPLAVIEANDYVVQIGLDVTGSCVTDTGKTTLNAPKTPKLEGIFLSDGTSLPKTHADYVAIEAALVDVVDSYSLLAYRTNSNQAMIGQLLNIDQVHQAYTVPLLAPISVLRPIGSDSANNTTDINALVSATKARMVGMAVSHLFETSATMRDMSDRRLPFDKQPAILGLASNMVRVTYSHAELDLLASTNSLTSTDRRADISAAIMNVVANMTYNLYVDAGYKAATDVFYGTDTRQPTVLIVTDPVTAGYMMLNGDNRTLGNGFDYVITTVVDERMQGKIFVALSAAGFDAGNTNSLNLLSFGNMLWRNELTLVMPVSRDNTVRNELRVQPSWRFITNCPILGEIDVTNLNKAVTNKLPIDFKTV